MTTTNCPNCGKPLRPGARFCGSCGYTIPATASAQASTPPASPATIPCPQCGKPIRVGSKFCSNCGKVLQQEPALPETPGTPAPPVETPVLEPPLKAAVQPKPIAAPAGSPPAGSSLSRVAAPTQSEIGPGHKFMWPLIVLALLVICVLGGGGAYVFLKDPFGWFAAAKASPTVPVPSQTLELAATASATEVVISTENPPTPTFTVAVVPAVTATPTTTLTASLEISPTIAFSPAVPVTGTTPSAPPAILLDDEFNGPLNINWKAWGSPRPILRSGPGDSWLELTATENPAMAGVTTRIQIANAPGNVIEFEGQLNPNYANFPLFFDWDPLQFDRGPENTTLTVLHLAIQNNRIVLQAPAANNTCQQELEGAKQHSYALKFVGDKQVALYIDGRDQAICQLDLGIMAIPGRISFTGTGWVTHVLVTGAELP